jgi:hypothetical protein
VTSASSSCFITLFEEYRFFGTTAVEAEAALDTHFCNWFGEGWEWRASVRLLGQFQQSLGTGLSWQWRLYEESRKGEYYVSRLPGSTSTILMFSTIALFLEQSIILLALR